MEAAVNAAADPLGQRPDPTVRGGIDCRPQGAWGNQLDCHRQQVCSFLGPSEAATVRFRPCENGEWKHSLSLKFAKKYEFKTVKALLSYRESKPCRWACECAPQISLALTAFGYMQFQLGLVRKFWRLDASRRYHQNNVMGRSRTQDRNWRD